MFRALADKINSLGTATDIEANAVLSTYPMQLSRFLDEVWSAGGPTSTPWQKLFGSTSPLPGQVKVTQLIGDITREEEPAGLLATLTSGLNYTDPTTPYVQTNTASTFIKY